MFKDSKEVCSWGVVLRVVCFKVGDVEETVVTMGVVCIKPTFVLSCGCNRSSDGLRVVERSLISTHDIEVIISVTVDQSGMGDVRCELVRRSCFVGVALFVVVCWPLASASSTTTQECSVGTDDGIAMVVSCSFTIHVWLCVDEVDGLSLVFVSFW